MIITRREENMLKILCVIMLFFVLWIRCSTPEYHPSQDSNATAFFQGEHELYPLNNKGSEILVFVDGFAGDSSLDKNVRFLWKNNKEQVMMASLPFSKVRLEISDSNYRSFCKFRWFSSSWAEEKWQDNIIYVVFIIKPEQIKFGK
jgi:hypothetical protein